MDKDSLAPTEVLCMQASGTNPAFAAAAPMAGAPPVLTPPLEDALPTARCGVNVVGGNVGRKENDEMEKMPSFSLCPSAEAGGPCPDETPVHATWEEASSAADCTGGVGKKGSRKRRNRKGNETMYFPWPLMLQTRASSAAPFLGQTLVTGALPVANVGEAGKEQRGNGEKEKTSVLGQPWKAPAGTWLPESRPVQPFLERTKGERNLQRKRKRNKGKNKKNKKIAAGPWPLTVQAWASFTGPALGQTTFTGSSPAAKDGVNVGPKSRDQRAYKDSMSILTLSRGTLAGTPGPPTAPGQASVEGASPAAKTGGKIGRKFRRKRRNRKGKRVLARPWPLTVQAWASFIESDPVPKHFQQQPLGQESWPPLQMQPVPPRSGRPLAKASLSAMAPLQTSLQGARFLGANHFNHFEPSRKPERAQQARLHSSVELAQESYQGWGNAERYPRDRHFWKSTVMNFARQVDCYREEPCSQERMEALALTKGHTRIGTSVMGMPGTERESQTFWMGKRGDF